MENTMSRPKPTVLLDYTDSETYKSEQVLMAEGIYAVFLDDQPINLRSLNKLLDYPGPKYRKISFANPGHAHNLAEKLNVMFKTDRFKVYLLKNGEIITENP
jgi:hypothetical protein